MPLYVLVSTPATTAIANLTIKRRGKRRIETLAELQATTDDILKRFSVEGLLEVHATFTIVERHIRAYRGQPARTEIDSIGQWAN